MVRVPQIQDLFSAIKLYYSKTELTNKDICELFGSLSSATVSKLKAEVRKEMREQEVEVFDNHRVNTRIAYIVWGLDISEMERNYTKLLKLGLSNFGQAEVVHE